MALRHASELRLRQQLLRLGVPAPALIPFGTMGYAKGKDGKEEKKEKQVLLAPYEERKDHGPSFIHVFDFQGLLCAAGGHWQLHLLHCCDLPKPKYAEEQVRAEVPKIKNKAPAQSWMRLRQSFSHHRDFHNKPHSPTNKLNLVLHKLNNNLMHFNLHKMITLQQKWESRRRKFWQSP